MSLDTRLPPTLDRAAPRTDVLDALHEAARLVAPQWPLTSFVAVNPLGGLEDEGFDAATALARRWTRGRSQLPLAELRRALAVGRVAPHDVDAGIRLHRPELGAAATVDVAGRAVGPVELVRRDLLVGPDAPDVVPAGRCASERWDLRWRTDLADRVDEVVTSWVVRSCGHVPAGEGLLSSWSRLGRHQRQVRRLLDAPARSWLDARPADPADALVEGLEALGVDPAGHLEELRGQVCRVRGWAGYARWCETWAVEAAPGARFALVDLAALRVTLEAAVLATASRARGAAVPPPVPPTGRDQLVDERAVAVAADLGASGDARSVARVAEVLAGVDLDQRPGLALAGLERALAAGLLRRLDEGGSGPALPPVYADTVPTRRPDPLAGAAAPAGAVRAQVVCCIDVRAEPLRRHLERVGPYETLGFAGFFGVAAAVREAGWSVPEPRCPVLVAPALEASTEAVDGGDDALAADVRARRRAGAADAALEAAHHGSASPFALAEAAGWIAGPRTIGRVLRPRPSSTPAPSGRLVASVPGLEGPAAVERLAEVAAGILRGTGLDHRPAPLVVLCGHTSHSRGNAHATALECGACGGASGAASARLAAALLDDPAVRRRLADQGLEVPADTWFVPAVHDTVTDRVTILDGDAVPATHRDHLAALEADLARAGAAVAAERDDGLPGSGEVTARGGDPGQVRPEWGLAGCAAMVIGPRSLTADLDLGGRAFLHSYDAGADPDGTRLEAVLTAPLVVGHWISAQYLFSSLDPEVFGAGDKLLHNPVAGVGVVTGPGGDLRVGLPLQSVAVGRRRVHEPLRLLAVVDAPATRVEAVVGRAPALRTLVEGSWVHVVARGPDGTWRWRTPTGPWADLDGEVVAS
jgi:uncharacterized protein YbcC (UPF0753/DUF2309 family)